MKKVAWIGALALVATTGYIAAGPYLAIAQIKTGISERDLEKLNEKIDFPILRQDLKEQLRAKGITVAAHQAQNNPLAALAAGLATTMVDGIVDSFVTPAGLASLMGGEKPSNKKAGRSDAGGQHGKDHLLENARYAYDSVNKFSVWVPTNDGEEIRFILQRDGLSWKLVRLVLPMSE